MSCERGEGGEEQEPGEHGDGLDGGSGARRRERSGSERVFADKKGRERGSIQARSLKDAARVLDTRWNGRQDENRGRYRQVLYSHTLCMLSSSDLHPRKSNILAKGRRRDLLRNSRNLTLTRTRASRAQEEALFLYAVQSLLLAIHYRIGCEEGGGEGTGHEGDRLAPSIGTWGFAKRLPKSGRNPASSWPPRFSSRAFVEMREQEAGRETGRAQV